jgi:hypothetical protein
VGFNADKFMQEKLEARRKLVPVPALASWFDEGEPAQWEVRGLTSNELYLANDAKQRRSTTDNIIKALTESGDQAKAIREAIGLTNNTPGEVVKRLEMLVMGSVTPKIELPLAVKLAEAFPIEFLMLTNEITTLTGMGYDVVKPPAASQPIPD